MLLRTLKNAFSRLQASGDEERAPPFNLPVPDQPLYIIGDIHGRDDLFGKLLELIDAHIEANNVPFPRLVFVGDYVDRGENSKIVLSLVYELCLKLPNSVTALLGNHEKMMLDFLDQPEKYGRRWLRNGGLQTLASFGIGGVSDSSGEAELNRACHRLDSALSKEVKSWLQNLPLHSQSGNVHFVHAAADPVVAMDAQTDKVLLWGNSAFLNTARTDGNWVVHGHTITQTPSVENGRISLDTGAYFSGQLSAVYLHGGELHFIST